MIVTELPTDTDEIDRPEIIGAGSFTFCVVALVRGAAGDGAGNGVVTGAF